MFSALGLSFFFNGRRKVSSPSQLPIGPPTSNNWQVGDSITKEPYQFPVATNGYAATFDAAKGITSQNLGYPSQGIWKGLGGYAQTLISVPDPYSLSLMMGFNDARGTILRTTSTDIIIGAAADVFSMHYGSTLLSFASAIHVGTWLNYGPTPAERNNPPRLNPTIQASQTPGDTLLMVFNGDAISIGTLLQRIPGPPFEDGSRGFTVHIDGVLKYTFDPSVLNCNGSDSVEIRGSAPDQYGWSPYAIILFGLGSGAHTCLITITAGSGAYFAWLDGIVELYPHASVASTQPACWIEIPSLNATGSSGSFTDATKIAQTNVDVWASTQFAWFRGYTNFGRVQTNIYYDPNDPAQVYSDNVHPSGFGDTTTGSYKIAQGLIAKMS